ncbi:hypothetical protein [Enterobacter soli]|uniref:hypothetical protein n=1 Tax=Enterobacter soli TaxID=885040 RepID=UPI003F85BA9D
MNDLKDGFWIKALNSLIILGMAAGGTALMILLVILLDSLTANGSAADWLGTLMDGVMAVTAIAAFVVARSWLPQLTTQEGYKLAIRLVNEEVLTLDSDNQLKQQLHNAVQKFCALRYQEKLIRGEAVLEELRAVTDAAEKKHRTIRRLEKQMATYGLVPAPARKQSFDAMMSGLENLIDEARSQWVLLTALARGGSSSEKINDLVMIDSYGLINRMGSGEAWTDLCNESLQQIDNAWGRMTQNQKVFLEADSRIGKLFTIRR